MNSVLTIFCAIATAITFATAQPRKERFAIVGAGFSGLSAAYHLAEAGYNDITIYEATNRVGGFVSTTRHDNVSHDLSAYGLTAAYWRYIAAMEKLGAEFCRFQSYSILPRTDGRQGKPVDTRAFAAGLAAQSLEDPSKFPELFAEEIEKYTKLFSELYGESYLNENLDTERLFPAEKPSKKAILEKLAMPMPELLNQEGLKLLLPFFRLFTNTQGYGPVDRMASLYVMSWVPPSLLLPNTPTLRPCGKYNNFQRLADLLLEGLQGKVKVHFNQPVQEVLRARRKRKVRVTLDRGVREYFDRVVVTTRLPQGKADSFLIRPISRLEALLAKRAESLEFYNVLLRGDRASVIGSDRLLSYDAGSLSNPGSLENFWTTLTHETGPKAGTSTDKERILREAGLIFYKEQTLGKRVKMTPMEKVDTILKRLSRWDTTKWEFLEGYTFRRYFQRWAPKWVREGYPWEFKRMQGHGRVYFISSYVCGFESVGHVFDCAKHMVDEHF